MKPLVQMVYISRSTAPAAQSGQGIDPSVARILAKSRVNNRNNGLVGVLYFGDGCFFQCLEGEEAAVDTLYAKLERDPRHTDLKIITRKPIDACSFENWSMKYVPVEQAMARLLQSRNMGTFDPYQFDAATLQDVLDLLLRSKDPAGPSAPATSFPATGAVPVEQKRRFSASAGAVAIALAVAATALFVQFY